MLNSVQVFVLATTIFAAFSATKVAAAGIPNAVVLMEGASTVDSVRAIWNRTTGEVTSYEIECSEGEATPASVNQTGDGPFSASCANLTNPGDEYTMVVTSLNNGESSQPANISLTALPNSPVLAEGPQTLNSVSTTWTKPTGLVTAYAINCSDGDTTPPSVNQTGDGPFNSSCLNLLTPGDQYIMYVYSISGIQRSHLAAIHLRAAPSPVTDLSELGATNDSVSAMWTKPPGVVDSYIVFCPDGSSTVEPENNDGSTHTVTCPGLTDPDGQYTIVVIARSGGKPSVPARVAITLNPYPSEVSTPTTNSATTSATASAITATTEGVSATTSLDNAKPTPAPQLELQYIIIIVVLLIVLIIIAFVAVLIFCRRLGKPPSDRQPLELTSHVNNIYEEVDEEPPPPHIYNDIGDQSRAVSVQNIYMEPDQTGQGDNATGITGASGGMSDSDSIKKKRDENISDTGGGVDKSNDYVDLPVYLNGRV